MCECGCPWNPEESTGSSGAGGKCEIWDTGAENPTQVLQRNANHPELLNQLSFTYNFKKKKDNLKSQIDIGALLYWSQHLLNTCLLARWTQAWEQERTWGSTYTWEQLLDLPVTKSFPDTETRQDNMTVFVKVPSFSKVCRRKHSEGQALFVYRNGIGHKAMHFGEKEAESNLEEVG